MHTLKLNTSQAIVLRATLPFVILLLVTWLLLCVCSTAYATSKTIKQKLPLKVAWVIEESLDGQIQKQPYTPQVWKKNLEALNFIYLDVQANLDATKQCDADEMLADNEMCEEVSSIKADLLIGGTAKATIRNISKDGATVGVKLDLELKVFRVDTGKMLFKISQHPYSTGPGATKALTNALQKITKPVSIMFSNLVAVHLKTSAEGMLKISGFKNSPEREDPLTSLRYIGGVHSLILEENAPDYTLYRIGYKGLVWGSLVRLINSTQGSGVQANITGNQSAEGTYKEDRAFRLLTGVAEVSAAASLAIDSEKSEQISIMLENQLDQIPYMMLVRFPLRLPNSPKKARKEIRLQCDGDIVLLPKIMQEADRLTLLVEVWSTFAGKMFSVDQEIITGDYQSACKHSIAKIKDKLPNMLKRRRNKMDRLKKKQFDAFNKVAGL